MSSNNNGSWKRIAETGFPGDREFPIWLAKQDTQQVVFLVAPFMIRTCEPHWGLATHWMRARLDEPAPPTSPEMEAFSDWYRDYFNKHGYPTQGGVYTDGLFKVFKAGIEYARLEGNNK